LSGIERASEKTWRDMFAPVGVGGMGKWGIGRRIGVGRDGKWEYREGRRTSWGQGPGGRRIMGDPEGGSARPGRGRWLGYRIGVCY